MQADPVHLQILTTVTRAWERAGKVAATPPLFSAAAVEAAWQQFRPLLGQPAAPPMAASPPAPALADAPPFPASRPLWPTAPAWPGGLLRIAAGAVLLLGAGYLLRNASWFPARAAATGSYASTTGRRFVRLPDGSGAWLNAHSRLHYAGFGPQGGVAGRAVQLTGEA